MPVSQHQFPSWLIAWMQEHRIALWGAAELEGFPTPKDGAGRGFLRALAWALPMNPQIMVGIQTGPNQAYADEYGRVNACLNELAAQLAAGLGGAVAGPSPWLLRNALIRSISRQTFPTKPRPPGRDWAGSAAIAN